jgi:hypothetical protein|tara:strand:+ start:978 stop:1388 length:411 start_codon:yes stop_codon:yes gene_type:complete
MMAKEIKLAKIADYMEGQIEQLLRVTVLETDSKLKQSSPVDTGRFRVSWQVGENANNSTPAPPGDYKGTPAPLKGSNYNAGQEKLGNYYSIHNNLPYAEPLANGHSPQADAGWVDLIGKQMQAYVRSQYEKIKRQG